MAQNYFQETGITGKSETVKINWQKTIGNFKWVSMTLLFMHLMFVIISMFNMANAQTYTPRNYWTFNSSPANKDSIGNFNLDFTSYACQYAVSTNGAVGKSLNLGTTGDNISAGTFVPDSAFTIEFLFKPGYNFNATTFFRRLDGAFNASMNLQGITFGTYTNGTGYDEIVISFNAIGRASYGYYIDNSWHHLVFKYSANTGLKEIYIDGECPSGFSKTISGKLVNGANTSLFFNQGVSYYKYNGDYDEIATYYSSLPKALVYKHYVEFRQQNKAYSFINNYSQTIPSPAAISGPLDMNEFAPGHPSVNVSALDQIKSYPTPRFKPGNTLLKNFNWVDLMYMGGRFQPGVTDAQSVVTSTEINEELAKNWNYMIQLKLSMDAWGNSWASLANQNPQLGASLITLRAQLYPSNIISQSLTTDKYFQNSSGTFLDPNGNGTSHKWWRPTASPTVYENDGTQQRANLQTVTNALTRPITMINENGEVFPWITDNALAMDPQVLAAKNASGLDFQTFQGRKFKENETQSYRDKFMTLPALANTKFTEYGIDGFPQYRQKYSEARGVNSQINGQYYSTPDFYPRWSYNWRNWVSAWHGWQWIVDSRYYELQVGDNLFSPFLAAGWDVNEENNIRPAQFLGLVKCLSMIGAEFFYTGYFNEQGNYNPPNPAPGNPANYAWQTAIPSYAQAVSSRYEDLLRHGQVMNGDVPAYISNTSKPGYTFWAGDLRKLVVIRKHNTLAQYAITGTIQPTTSMIGGAENESVATITLDGQQLKFNVRRQGSTYIYDKTNAASPIFYQLDEWHEKTHPSYWSKDFTIESELYDNASTTYNLKTTVPAGTPSGDYTNYTTSVVFSPSQTTFTPLEYSIQPRSASQSNLYLWVRARSVDGTATGVSVSLDNGTAKTIGCVTDTNWTWYRYDACNQQAISFNGLSLADHIIRFTPSNNKLMFDKFVLSSNSSFIANAAPAGCSSGSSATVTASGATSFCQGSNVTLTASAGTSYLWSNGATTQAITVNQSGNYSVSVFQTGGCAAVSNPINVTVNSLPVSTITASGPTTICQGNNVTLTASAGASYLWSNGATTQAITVSTAGNYTVKVTNAQGCESTSAATAVTVTTGTSATITAGGPTTFCQGGSVVLTANTGTSYLWSNGATSKSITVSTTGQYSVTVNNGSCSATSSAMAVTVSSSATATVTASGATTFCQGGSVTLTASAGSSYVWSNGATTQSINVNSTGQYSVTVSSGSCSATSSAMAVTVSSSATATVTASGATTFCQGGSVTLTASAGSSYVWSNGATTQSINVNSTGQYSVTVSSGSCSATSAATSVTVANSITATVTASGATTFCQGGSVTLTASAGSSYLWSNGATTQSINVNSTGQYSVTVSNGSCSATSAATTVTVANSTTATITASGATTFCQGGSVTLTASAGSSYVWSNGATTQSINVNSTGQYSVTVSNGSCSATSAATTVTVANSITATITANGATTFCPGGSVSLTASAGTSYLWSNGSTTQTINVTNAGQYSVTVSNGSCSATSPVTTVTIANSATATITTNGATTFCQGGSVTLAASAGSAYLWSNGAITQSINVNTPGQYSVTVTNGTCTATSVATAVTVNPIPSAVITAGGPIAFCQGGSVALTASSGASYLWSNGATTQSIAASTSGAYTVKVTTASCSATSAATNVSVVSLPAATITAGGATTFCQGGSVSLTASQGLYYTWSNGATTQTISASATGQYSVTVSTSVCSATSAITPVVVSSVPTPVISTSGSTNLTQGQSVTLTASAGASYVWSNGATTQAITVTTAGSYYVRVTNASGCQGVSNPVAVTVATTTSPASISSSSATNSICSGSAVTLTASPGTNYIWLPTLQATPTITVSTPGTYTVNVLNANGTTSSASIIIIQAPSPAAPQISYSYVPSSAYILNAFEGSAVSYSWSTGQSVASIQVNSAGVYSARSINAYGCISPASTIKINSLQVQNCKKPDMLTAYNILNNQAVLSWNPAVTADSFLVAYAVKGTSNIKRAYVKSTNYLLVKELSVASIYEWTVTAICASGQYKSDNANFSTLAGPTGCGSTVLNTQTNSVTNSSAQLSWFGTTASAVTIRYKKVGALTYSYKTLSVGNAAAWGYNLTGLAASTTYQWGAKTSCGTVSSGYSNDINFTTKSSCPQLAAPVVVNVKSTSAEIKWLPDAQVPNVTVRYAPEGSTNYQYAYASGATGTVAIKSLKPTTKYNVWIRSVCSLNSMSTWGNAVSFNTGFLRLGDEGASTMQLNAYPNPASDRITFAFNAEKSGEYALKVCDMTGRELTQETRMAEEGANSGEIILTNYSTGMYLLVIKQGGQQSFLRFQVNK